MGNVVAAVMAIFFAMAPVKSYVKPGEPVLIRFAQSDSDKAPKYAEILGLKALDIPDLFKAAAAADIIDDKGTPLFQLYSLDGNATKLLKPIIPAKPDLSTGTIDLAAYFPGIRDVGTYILTWKSATALVINTLPNPGEAKNSPPVATHIVPLEYALISTDKGDIKATFAYDVAPNTIANFVTLSNEKFYDGTVFHRIIKDFMIQGGDSLGTSDTRAGSGGPGHAIVQEFSDKPHVRGVLSMARTSDPNSAGSQFFIIHGKADFLNGKYAAFGQVIDGMNVVDKIADTSTVTEPDGSNNGSTKPGDRPVIKSIRILSATPDMYGIKP